MSREFTVDVRFTFATDAVLEAVEVKGFNNAFLKLLNDFGPHDYRADGPDDAVVEFVSAAALIL